MEQYWFWIGMASSQMAIMGNGYLLYRLLRPYAVRVKAAAWAGIVYTAVMVTLYFIPWEMPGMFAYGAGAAAAFGALYGLDRRCFRQKLFLCLAMYLLEWSSHGIAVEFRSILFGTVLNTFYMAVRPWRQLCFYLVVEFRYITARFLIMAGLVWLVNRVYACKKEDMDSREFAMMLVTPLLVLAGYGAFSYMANIYEADLGQYIWDVNPGFSLIKTGCQILSCPAILIQLALYQHMKESHKKETEAMQLAGQVADMKAHLREVEGLYEEIRGLKHDVGNHLMVMEQLVGQSRSEEAAAYLKSWRGQLKQAAPAILTGNPVTDVVLEQKQRKARELGVELICELQYPQGTRLDTFDVSILLNNALDNALEAAGKARGQGSEAPGEESLEKGAPVVKLCSWRRKNAFMMEVSNPFSGTLEPDGETGLPKSSKKGRKHGFGLANMRKVAQSYQGDLEIRAEEGRFVLTVLLMVE